VLATSGTLRYERTVSETPEQLPLGVDVVARLVGNHRDFLRFLERRVGRRDLAEEILQDAFVRSIAKLETLRNEESAVAWFYRALRNAVVDHHRRRRSSEKALETYAHELEVVTEEPETKGAICACVGELAQTLKPEYAEVLRRVELEGVSVKDFAEQQGISASNAGVRIFRAREALRKRVAQSCGTCAEHGCLDCTCGSGHCG
jgi:RNA polymerase sigma factor (sigma-70 family)